MAEEQGVVSGPGRAVPAASWKAETAYVWRPVPAIAPSVTTLAAAEDGDRRGGVIWHTQGSGESLTMAFFARKVIAESPMANPKIVVLTDRLDLDGELGVFARCADLLRQTPEQAADRTDLRRLLTRAAGGVVFTTIQKLLPEEKGDHYPALSNRRNIVVIADEAHRSQYDFIDGYVRHMRDALPNATFVGFTGTPLELDDRDARAVFGEYIDRYVIRRAVEDHGTVPIYYESRLAKLDLPESERPPLDKGFEEVTEGEEESRKERLKTKWAQRWWAGRRLALVAEDLLRHWEERLQALDGKAMVVAMSRRICVDLHVEFVKLRPVDHHHDEVVAVEHRLEVGAVIRDVVPCIHVSELGPSRPHQLVDPCTPSIKVLWR